MLTRPDGRLHPVLRQGQQNRQELMTLEVVALGGVEVQPIRDVIDVPGDVRLFLLVVQHNAE